MRNSAYKACLAISCFSRYRLVLLFALVLLCVAPMVMAQQARTWWVDSLDLGPWYTEGQVQAEPLLAPFPTTSKGQAKRGIALPLPAATMIRLAGGSLRFMAWAGLQPTAKGKAQFMVRADGLTVWTSDSLVPGAAPVLVDVDLKGVEVLELLTDAGWLTDDRPVAYWADAKVLTLPTAQFPRDMPRLVPWLGTAGGAISAPPSQQTPVLMTPSLILVYPNADIHQYVAIAGAKPMRVSAGPMPPGLRWDAKNQVITGQLSQGGTYTVPVFASNTFGKVQGQIRFKVSYQVLPAAVRGWVSPMLGAKEFNQLDLEHAMRAMQGTGLQAAGWDWLVPGDGWQGERSNRLHSLTANKKFPLFEDWLARAAKLGFQRGLFMTTARRSPGGYLGTHADSWTGKLEPEYNYLKRGKLSFVAEDALQWKSWQLDGLWLQGSDLDTNDAVAWRVQLEGKETARWLGFEHYSPTFRCHRTPAGAVSQHLWYNTSRPAESWLHWRQQVLALRQARNWECPVSGRLTTAFPLDPFFTWPDHVLRQQVVLFAMCGLPLWLQDRADVLEDKRPTILGWLSNPELMFIHQAGTAPATCVQWSEQDQVGIWTRKLPDGALAIAFINLSGYGRTVSYQTMPGTVRDVLARKSLGKANGSLSCTVPARGAEVWVVRR